MSVVCDCCGQPRQVSADAFAAKLEELLATVEQLDLDVSVDGFVSERVAAVLLGKSERTLKNWRFQHCPIPFRRIGRTPQYAVADLARYLVDAEVTESDSTQRRRADDDSRD